MKVYLRIIISLIIVFVCLYLSSDYLNDKQKSITQKNTEQVETSDINDRNDTNQSDEQTLLSSMYAFINQYETTIQIQRPDYDFYLTFRSTGPNDLYAIAHIDYFKNGELVDSYEATSDWIGPYIVRAKTSVINHEPVFTGGWHVMDDDKTLRTAYSDRVEIKCDKVLITNEYEQECDVVEIEVRNNINAYNTITPVLQEVVTYTITKKQIDIYVEIEALDDLVIERYYGLQSENALWKDKVSYIYSLENNINDNFSDLSVYNQSKSKKDSITQVYQLENSEKNRILEVGLNFVGLGEFTYLENELPTCFTAPYGKSYFNLVNGIELNLNQGEKVFWKGYYKFIQ